jgi:hypothetical protein
MFGWESLPASTRLRLAPLLLNDSSSFFYDSFIKRPDDNRPTVLLSVQEIRPSPAGMPESSGH